MVDFVRWESCLLNFHRGLDGTIQGVVWTMDTRVTPLTFRKLEDGKRLGEHQRVIFNLVEALPTV